MPEPTQYRSFLNTDPPLIVELWRSLPAVRGVHSEVTIEQLEVHVLSKPYFDRKGFFVAVEIDQQGKQQLLAMVHASFVVNDELSDLDRTTGVISLLRSADCEGRCEIEDKLLAMATEYLSQHGAGEVWFGSRFPRAPFYLGLYGGSRMPGVVEDDQHTIAALQRNGFESDKEIIVLHRELQNVQSVKGRQQLMVRRNYLINAIADPVEKSWWECCTLGMAERDRFTIGRKKDNHVAGTVSFWDMQPIGGSMHSNCRGLYDLSINKDDQREGLASFLVCEALKRLASNGVTFVEAQAESTNAASRALFEKLDFVPVGKGFQFRKVLKT